MENKTYRLIEYTSNEDFFNLKEAIEWLGAIDCQYLIVYHNQDTNTPHHYHCFIRFNVARSLDDITKKLKCNPQELQYIKNYKNALAYGFHLTESAKNKYQYDKSCIVSSKGIDIDSIFDNDKKIKDKKNRVEQLLVSYIECKINKKKLYQELTPLEQLKNFNQIEKAQKLRAEYMGVRDMKVIYISGNAGSGKTTLAKFLAEMSNYDYFVSGSGGDILDGYDKEECIILDDLRGDSFTKAELFKLTDNHTNSSVKSRYRNKDISRCKLMIITSVKTPYNLYNWNDDKEPSNQFARRLNYMYVKIEDNGKIYNCPINDKLAIQQPLHEEKELNMQVVFSALNIMKQAPTIATIMKYAADEAKRRIAEKEELPF